MLKSFLLIVLLSLSMALSAQSIKATFVQINVVQLDPITEDVIDSWETRNYCTYEADAKKSRLTYIEKTPKGQIVQEWNYEIVGKSEDETVHKYLVRRDEGTIVINIWKDLSMVSLEGTDAIYLVAGLVNSAR